jgi:hypothetical protein
MRSMPTVVLRALPAQLAEQHGEVGCAKRICVPGWPFAHKDALKAAGFWWDSDRVVEGAEGAEDRGRAAGALHSRQGTPSYCVD